MRWVKPNVFVREMSTVCEVREGSLGCMQAQRCAEPASTTTTALSLHAGCAASVRSAPPCRGIDALGHWCSLPVRRGSQRADIDSESSHPVLALRYPQTCKFRTHSAAPFDLVGDAVCPTQPTDNPLNAFVDDDWGHRLCSLGLGCGSAAVWRHK